ncbi:hypothetical protein [Brevundimonas nasdae]|uniref:Diguanylate cyclase n=1 Tax=Brevundimonas nasdae TaxID=172043 RepID=A0ABX8TCU0_9CAUL|nr:hypothetical protein [Brevundimonas nasdae]QYC08975.1 hypothetical protein KWG56_10020 [Brevundimonas nasdae]QYC15025.1 hypothetical protein KWG63_05355 [Brevundimonas nasdae]
MDLLQALATLYQILGFAAGFIVIAVALLLGGPSHRACAIIALVDALGLYVLMSALDLNQVEWMVQLRSILVFLAYGLVVFRWSDRWLVLLMGLQGFAVLLHLSNLLDDSIHTATTSLLLNATGWLMLILLATASVAHAFQRSDEKRRYTSKALPLP